jgi:hypothetical protein
VGFYAISVQSAAMAADAEVRRAARAWPFPPGFARRLLALQGKQTMAVATPVGEPGASMIRRAPARGSRVLFALATTVCLIGGGLFAVRRAPVEPAPAMAVTTTPRTTQVPVLPTAPNETPNPLPTTSATQSGPEAEASATATAKLPKAAPSSTGAWGHNHNCEVPYLLERDGTRTFKPGCLAGIPSGSAVAVSPATAGSERPNCHPNYWLDDKGDKHFKPECFLPGY